MYNIEIEIISACRKKGTDPLETGIGGDLGLDEGDGEREEGGGAEH